jgi:hypothetical protein
MNYGITKHLIFTILDIVLNIFLFTLHSYFIIFLMHTFYFKCKIYISLYVKFAFISDLSDRFNKRYLSKMKRLPLPTRKNSFRTLWTKKIHFKWTECSLTIVFCNKHRNGLKLFSRWTRLTSISVFAIKLYLIEATCALCFLLRTSPSTTFPSPLTVTIPEHLNAKCDVMFFFFFFYY